MKELKIENLVYLMKEAKESGKPQPIFFLGAGASSSGKIPLTQEIVKHILDNYAENPSIKDLSGEQKNYAKLMSCLTPNERNHLLKGYIDEAKINVTHIYLAQLLKEGYADYILTVNFDNLMLRALAMFNIFPSTYDLAILKDLTTTTFKEKSVVYLHGQSHGLWLLNTSEEMEKVKTIIPRIFDSIKNERPWIFIGYSGEDPVFEHIRKLGRFDNSLYWITYNDNNPKNEVADFISNPHTNAFLIKGYDSDSFMLELNNQLGLEQPNIIDKPFTALNQMLQEIVDIDEKEHFQGVKERLEIAKKQVEVAIQKYETGKIDIQISTEELEIDKLKKEIINLIINKDYDITKISIIENKVKKNDNDVLYVLLAGLYNSWGNTLEEVASNYKGEEQETLYYQAIEKYKRAIEIQSDKYITYYNWGNVLGILAKNHEGKEQERLYHQAIEKYEKAVEINQEDHEIYNNWGNVLGDLANNCEGKEKERLYHQAIEKYEKAIEINQENDEVYNNWGVTLGDLANNCEGKEKERLYYQAIEKYEKAIEINQENDEVYNNWGVTLGDLAKNHEGKEQEKLYYQAIEKYEKAIEIKPDKYDAYHNWRILLNNLLLNKQVTDERLFYQNKFQEYKKNIENNPKNYSIYSAWKNDLKEFTNKIKILTKSE